MSPLVTSGDVPGQPPRTAPGESQDGPAVSVVNRSVVERVDAALRTFLAGQRPVLEAAGPDLGAVADAAVDFVFAGGKRMRPLFAYWGWRCVKEGGTRDEGAVLTAAASLELLHAAALVHDDLIDDSSTRRGQPAAHARFAAVGGSVAFGDAAAILLGDLLLSWSAALFARADLPPAASDAARGPFELMATEMMAGQYLDMLEQSRGSFSVEAALRVARYKSSKYTVERPLLVGAGAGGAAVDVQEALSAFGLPLGEAFQLRDDVLGVFGDPGQTGKPAGDDLREGKRTVLVALAHAAAGPAQRRQLVERLGDPDLDTAGVDVLREIIVATGALRDVEAMIIQRADQALAALSDAVIRPDAQQALTVLAQAATVRQH